MYKLEAKEKRALMNIIALEEGFESTMELGKLVLAVATRDFEQKYGRRRRQPRTHLYPH